MLDVLGQVGGLSDERLQAASHHSGPLLARVRPVQPPTGPFQCARLGRRPCVLADLVEESFEQVAGADEPHPVEIDQLALDSVRGRTPPILRYGK
jgi:hypothetical protein